MAADNERELWDPDAQGRDVNAIAEAARAGIAAEWTRVWETPIPYYRDKFEAAGLSATDLPPLDDIPRTTKSEFRDDDVRHPPFGSYRGISLEGAVRIGVSTGTTGTPTMIFYGPRDLEAHIRVGVRNLWRHGMRPGNRFTHSWPQGLYPSGVAGGRTYLELGVLEIPVGPPFSVEVATEHLRLWEILQPHGFMITSAQLQTYQDAAQAAGIDLLALLDGAKVAFLEASCQFTGPRTRVESTYGFRLHNIGGASEVPALSTSDCRFHTGLHVTSEHFVIQACDPNTGAEVPEGERGSLVVSAFGLDAFYLRYDLEDIVTVSSGSCPCGETGPRYTLLGRAADAVVVEGRMLLPLDVQLALDEHGAPEFQVVRDGEADGKMRLRVEQERAARLEGPLQEQLRVPVVVEEVSAGTLPRSSFKPRRVS